MKNALPVTALEAIRIEVNFWSERKLDIERQPDGLSRIATAEPERFRGGIRQLHGGLNEADIQPVCVESGGTGHECQTSRGAIKDFAPQLFQNRGTR